MVDTLIKDAWNANIEGAVSIETVERVSGNVLLHADNFTDSCIQQGWFDNKEEIGGVSLKIAET